MINDFCYYCSYTSVDGDYLKFLSLVLSVPNAKNQSSCISSILCGMCELLKMSWIVKTARQSLYAPYHLNPISDPKAHMNHEVFNTFLYLVVETML